EETLDMQSFSFYRPKYGFEDSEHYASKLATIREAQEALVKAENATQCPQEWTVDGSAAKGRKMIKAHAKLMLRAFNGECDAAIAKVKYNNVNNLENRINKSFEAINKLGESKKLWITRDYLNLKLQELYLVHEHREKVEEEKEEQRHIKEQMREEEKALKEIEKAKKEAEKDEATKMDALEKARQELAEAQGRQTDRLRAIVDRLEGELKEALERKAKLDLCTFSGGRMDRRVASERASWTVSWVVDRLPAMTVQGGSHGQYTSGGHAPVPGIRPRLHPAHLPALHPAALRRHPDHRPTHHRQLAAHGQPPGQGRHEQLPAGALASPLVGAAAVGRPRPLRALPLPAPRPYPPGWPR